MKKDKAGAGIKIIPLGGISEVGKNLTVIESKDDIIVIDCGLAFPKGDMLGVDYVIPDVTYLEKNASRIRAFIITHGHEDHIGATPYVLPKFKAPVYATKLTIALIETKLSEHEVRMPDMRCVEAGDVIKCGGFSVEFIKVVHSIDDAVGLAITTSEGVIVHTGDFKIDHTPIDGRQTDLGRFAQLGEKGVLALMSDSTNAERMGYTISEKKVGETFDDYFDSTKGRIIVATFSSNIHRLQQVIDVAKKYNRKICLSGRSMVKIAGVATELGYLKLPEKMQISLDEIDKVRDNKIVILTTGSQGEPMSGLVRMAAGEHNKCNIKAGDTVIISSTPIPGNERYVSDVINMLYRRGATVIYGGMAKVHVSGHACREELKLILSLTKPKYFIPVHGEYRQLYKHASLAEELGIPKQNTFVGEIGLPIELTKKKAQFGEPVPSGAILIDGIGIGDVGNVVLRDRKLLSQDGLFMVIIPLSKDNEDIATEPEIVSRGFIYVKESEELIETSKLIVKEVVQNCRDNNVMEYLTIKAKVKKALNEYLYGRTKRSPMILPIIIEI